MSLQLIKKHITPLSILDIGANHGQFYCEARKIFPDSYFYLIEGNPYCEPALKGFEIDYTIALLSDKEKEVDFFIRNGETSCTGNSIYKEDSDFYKEGSYFKKQLFTKTLDSVLQEKRFDLIKLDVQGSELDIIRGGLDIVKAAKALLLEVAVTDFNIGAPKKEEVFQYLASIGFEPVEKIADLNHPILHTLVQQDFLFLNKSYDK
jgi:FkbM family methyltransferase